MLTFTRLVMAFIWLFSNQNFLAPLPFFIYSVFHIARSSGLDNSSTSRDGKLPSWPIAYVIGQLRRRCYGPSMYITAFIDIITWVGLLGFIVLYQESIWFHFLAQTAFLCARYATCPYMRSFFGG